MSTADNGGGSSSWVINVDKSRVTGSGSSSSQSERWKSIPCIYKIPDHITGPDPKPYRPQLVSIGPFNYKEEGTIWTPMEAHKYSTLRSFNARSKTPFAVYREILRHQLEYLIYPHDQRYDFIGDKFANDESGYLKFLDMMIMDGCFIIEILLRLGTSSSSTKNYYFSNDDDDDDAAAIDVPKIFTRHGKNYILPLIKQDMLLLENQVPFWLLEFLEAGVDGEQEKLRGYHVGDQTGSRVALLDLIIKHYSLPESTRRIEPPYLHILDIYRRGLISENFSKHHKERIIHDDDIVSKHAQTVHYFPSASKLYEAGIPFQRSQTTNLKDISFHRGTLRFPPIVITKDTISTLKNLMAFERLHVGAGSEVTSYVFFLNCLIHNTKDVSLLESREIIQHTLRDDEDVVKSLGLISKDVDTPPDDMLDEIYIVSQQLRHRQLRKRLNVWRIDLLQKYFNTPWGALSVLAAILLFTLTTIQTVYTVLSYVHRK